MPEVIFFVPKGPFYINELSDELIVECKFNPKFKKWEPFQKTNEKMSLVSDI